VVPVGLFGVTRMFALFFGPGGAPIYGGRKSTLWKRLERNCCPSEEIQSHPINLLAYVRPEWCREYRGQASNERWSKRESI
jgi:hypothetical protein